MKKIQINVNYKTQVGENLYIRIQQDDSQFVEYAMHYTENGFWRWETETKAVSLSYNFIVKNSSEEILNEEINLHQINLNSHHSEYLILNSWNQPNFPENYLNTKILKQISAKKGFRKPRPKRHETHRFSIQVPIYNTHESIVLLGNTEEMGNWNEEKPIPLKRINPLQWEISLELSPSSQKIEYKYAILNHQTGKLSFEEGENRKALPNKKENCVFVYQDQSYKFHAHEKWKSAGVAVPVFSLRTENSFGVGEFFDLKKLVDWAVKTHLSILQVLPVNDTTATHTWTDSYPYAAISVYALHPQYLALNQLSYPLPAKANREFNSKRKELNTLPHVDYEAVMKGKWHLLFEVFKNRKKKILKDKNFAEFRKKNQEWLLNYAVFCTLRDKYGTADYKKWSALSTYKFKTVERYARPSHIEYDNVIFHSWIQYELHLQLKEAVDYAHSKNVFIKGDLPIGIYRYSVEAWSQPEQFGLEFQAGAPPDFFTAIGQNWGFPTYNWETMKQDGYRWWKNRFKALAQYFDVMRIDHILGFFRIWRMPLSATQAILGYFHPAVPISEEEFAYHGISFNPTRFLKPFINDAILWHSFGEEKKTIIETFLEEKNGLYYFLPEFDTQRKIENYFQKTKGDFDTKMKLLSLASNVLFVEEEVNGKKMYHPRFGIYDTLSYQFLEPHLKEKLYHAFHDYFFGRQEELWEKSGMEKLPVLLQATDMLICGEDLGFVPDCVPKVMNNLGIIALKVQRSPKEDVAYYHPQTANYENVVTYSTHDSTTLRQWWKEDRNLTQKYFNEQLQQSGEAPEELRCSLAEIVMKQHLYNQAMLAIFPIQEFLATDESLKNPDANAERINDPGTFPHYWKYRMHKTLEELIAADDFNSKIAFWIKDSKRV